MKSLSIFALLAAILAAPAFAGPREDEREAVRALRGIPPPELPVRAAEVVAAAPAANRSAVATAVLAEIARRTPSSAPAVRSALVNSGALPPTAKVPTVAPPRPSVVPKSNNGRFGTAPPHGGNPPGHNGQPDRKGPPPFVDYTKPRSF